MKFKKNQIYHIITGVLCLIIVLMVLERTTLKNTLNYENNPFWGEIANEEIKAESEDEEKAEHSGE